MLRFLSLLILCTLLSSFYLEEPEYHRVAALRGDGIYSLLRRYGLDQYNCNIEQFYELNKLKKGASLIKGVKYFIPVLIYRYDGKSIRSTIGISDWDQAVRIKNYNEAILDKGLRKSTYAKSRILWVPHHELHCTSSDKDNKKTTAKKDTETTEQEKETKVTTPPAPKVVKLEDKNLSTQPASNRTFPIFGSKFAYTPLQSTALKGKVFYIVSGHGGIDPGAVGKRAGNALCEDEYAYDVALRLCRNLIAHGATAYMIVRDPNDGIRSEMYLQCDKDELIWKEQSIYRSQKPRLFQRSTAINKLYEANKRRGVTEQTAIMMHVDSRNRSSQIDLFFYHHPDSNNGKKVATQLHRTMRKKYRKYRSSGEYHGTVTGRDLHMLREVKPTAIYIELGNISHPQDQKRIILEDNRQAIANWLLEGLMK